MKRILLSVALAALIAGCASAPVREGVVSVAPGERVLDLKAGSYFFSPAQLTIPAGESAVLRIANEATVIPHSFVLVDRHGNVLIRQALAKGSETLIRIAPLAEGTYAFYCGESFLGRTHRGKGMQGKLTVAPASAPAR